MRINRLHLSQHTSMVEVYQLDQRAWQNHRRPLPVVYTCCGTTGYFCALLPWLRSTVAMCVIYPWSMDVLSLSYFLMWQYIQQKLRYCAPILSRQRSNIVHLAAMPVPRARLGDFRLIFGGLLNNQMRCHVVRACSETSKIAIRQIRSVLRLLTSHKGIFGKNSFGFMTETTGS